jgi:GNAT superfamily N-acetyltransferase
VGHVQLSRAWVGVDPVLALGPVGVLPDLQRKGIGRASIEAAAKEARRRNEVAMDPRRRSASLPEVRLPPRFRSRAPEPLHRYPS